MKCQIYGSSNKKELVKLCSNMKIMGPFFPDKDSRIVSCNKCGSVYVDIDVDQSAFTSYYASNYSKSLSYFDVFGKEEAEKYYEGIEKRIRRYVEKDGHILEIGGGLGELAKFLTERGYSDITVMEPSEKCVRICEKRGLKTILSDSITISEELENSFDFIIINHTLEHILDFHKTLQSAHRMLKEGCGMYVEVPDAAMYAETNFVPYWFFTYEHIVHMTLKSFDNISRAFSFLVSEKESYLKCRSYHVMYAVFIKTDKPKEEPIYLADVEKSVIEYRDVCQKRLEPAIKKMKETGEPIILWGIGTSTAQLLHGNFDECNVIKLVDSNSYRQNVTYTIAGKRMKIEDPSTIDTQDTILILPLMYDTSIRKQIREMGLKNKVQSLIENYKSGLGNSIANKSEGVGFEK